MRDGEREKKIREGALGARHIVEKKKKDKKTKKRKRRRKRRNRKARQT